jgi:hypothetical protein
MTVKKNQILKNYKQLNIITLLAFGSFLLIISGLAVASTAYGAFPSDEITNAENVVKNDISHEQAVVKNDISHEQAVVKAEEERFPTPAIP